MAPTNPPHNAIIGVIVSLSNRVDDGEADISEYAMAPATNVPMKII
jgi:hypothetical protein